MPARLSVTDATFSYDGVRNVFDEVSFDVNRGEIFCILGPTGIGKSTLLRCLANLFRIKSGKIEVDGRDISSMPASAIARRIGFIPQLHYPAFPYTVGEVVLMGRTPHLNSIATPSRTDLEIAEQAMATIHILYLRDKPYTAISGGEMQMVLLARVLAQQSDILLLDEPTSHLDIGNQMRTLEVLDDLAKRGYSVVMTTHAPDQAFITNCTVAVMAGGRFVAVGPADEAVTEERMQLAYGTAMRVVQLGDGINRKICVPLVSSRSSTGTQKGSVR
jgi:iron complex transport system ATP-binding protein